MWPVNSQPDDDNDEFESTCISENKPISMACDEGNPSKSKPNTPDIDGISSEFLGKKDPKLSCPSQQLISADEHSLRRRSASRDSSVNDDPKSLVDSISAASLRQNWSGKEVVEDDPSISSIKGDSVSATIADYDRKHRAQASDDQSRTSARLGIIGGGESSPKTDDLSSNINFYAAGGSTSGAVVIGNPGCSGSSSAKPGDFVSVSSIANVEAFDIIEESSNKSSCDDLTGHINRQNQRKSQYHSQQKRRQSTTLEQALEIDDLPQEATFYQVEPIVLRGNGNLTLFGLSNSFSAEFPSALIGRVSREEFDYTMRRINNLLRDQQSLSAKLLLFGGLCCCCSLGFSLVWPSIALKKRSKTSLEKLLAGENHRFYSKLGLNWKLAEQRCYSNHAFVEYVLMIEFTPKINLYLPD